MNKRKITTGSMLMLMMLAVVATFNITFFVASEYYNKRLGNFEELEGEYKKFKEVSDIVDKYYVGEADEQAMMDGAMHGYIDGMGDKWSTYLSADEYKTVLEKRENQYAGVGITVSIHEESKNFTITAVAENSPAAKAGIKPFDVLLAVDGKSVASMSYDDVSDAVRGKEGTSVKLTVSHEGVSHAYELKRAEISTPGVKAQMLENKIGLIRIESFSKNVDKEFAQKLKELLAQGAKGLVFDVRFNPGGFVDTLVPILDEILPEGTIISITDKAGQTTDYKSEAECLMMPMAVLTNEYSISAAEFFAASLQEYGVATVVGEKTGGKGYAQNLIPLPDGSAVNISTSRYYTPKGVSLAGKGVTPDEEVSLSEEHLKNFYQLTPAEDEQLQAATKILTKQIG